MQRLIPFLINEHRKLKKRLSLKATWLRLALHFLLIALAVFLLDLGVSLGFVAGSLCIIALMYGGIIHIGDRARQKQPT